MGIVKVFYRSPHNYDLMQASDEAVVCDFGPSLTVQADAKDCDLNVIMERFGITGRMPDGFRLPTAADFGVAEPLDFRTAQEYVIKARHEFETLPASVRARFGNDPQELLSFVLDDANRAEAERLGLVKAKEPAPQAPSGSSAPPGASGSAAAQA